LTPLEEERLAAVPSLPHDAEGPVFAEPWQAEAFAMAVGLNERGLFTWTEWAQALASEIAAAPAADDADPSEAYYRCWLTALERLVVERGLTTDAELDDRRSAWDRAARATPHGGPIVLPAG
jgi:nitrile hydratase accessory protein